MRYLFTLQYLGTRYAGWQRQANAIAIQQIVEEALSRMFGAPIHFEGAGRTDSGVHARAQRAHADLPFEIGDRGLLLGLNDLLPHDIRVTSLERVADDFHCRFKAKTKTYVYRIWNDPVADVFAHETHAHVVQIRVSADGFLRYMVRRIAGSLIEIGRGKIEPGALVAALEPSFREARWTAPAKGLVLWEIAY